MPEGEESEEIIAEKFSNQVKETVTQVQEGQKIPSRKNPNKLTPRHIIIKMPKTEDK